MVSRFVAGVVALAAVIPTFAVERLPPRSERTQIEQAEHFEQLRRWYQTEPENWPAPTLDPGVEHRELGRLPAIVHPKDNPFDPAKTALGKQLFFDPRLSGSGQIACASCHDPDLGWADGRTTAYGHNRRKLGRNSPSILNSGYRMFLFWDGRAGSLEEQAIAVLNNQDEMHSGDEVLVENLASIPEYVASFRQVFGAETPGIEEVAKAIAAYERTVVSGGTRFDSFIAGRHNAFTDEELSGLHLFRTEGRCLNCHNGPLFTDDRFHAIGLGMYGRKGEDLGRYAVTNQAEDVGAFRTPSLRDIARTRPYMHSGLFDLDEILRLYNAGMPTERHRATDTRDVPPPQKSPLIKSLGLNKTDLADLAAFLETLTESNRRVTPPVLPPGL